MIKILFPPGCYGTYLTRCVYNYSNLRQEEFIKFEFGNYGSSHVPAIMLIPKNKLQRGHITDLQIDKDDVVVSLLPDPNESLEYYNNQLYKQEKGQIIQYINSSFSEQLIAENLKKYWGYTKKIDQDIPRWIIREWCSFWITDSWTDGYDRHKYQQAGTLSVEVCNLLTDISATLNFIFDYLELKFSVQDSLIKKTHQEFLFSQKFLYSQTNCQLVVDYVLNSNLDIDISAQTIFDEAYIQYLLRTKGYEIRCDGVNNFPKSSNELKKIIYKV